VPDYASASILGAGRRFNPGRRLNPPCPQASLCPAMRRLTQNIVDSEVLDEVLLFFALLWVRPCVWVMGLLPKDGGAGGWCVCQHQCGHRLHWRQGNPLFFSSNSEATNRVRLNCGAGVNRVQIRCKIYCKWGEVRFALLSQGVPVQSGTRLCLRTVIPRVVPLSHRIRDCTSQRSGQCSMASQNSILARQE
jgi:hypothetical protein